jgi:hypothetical protein
MAEFWKTDGEYSKTGRSKKPFKRKLILTPVDTTEFFDNIEYKHGVYTKGKQCCRCKDTFPATSEFFGSNIRAKDGLNSYCKTCNKIRCADYNDRTGNEVRKKTQKNKLDSNPTLKYARNFRTKFQSAFKKIVKNDKLSDDEIRWVESVVGCTLESFIKNIKSKLKPHQNFKNYGTVWVLDHNIPYAWHGQLEDNMVLLHHFSNLYPLDIELNKIKSARCISDILTDDMRCRFKNILENNSELWQYITTEQLNKQINRY